MAWWKPFRNIADEDRDLIRAVLERFNGRLNMGPEATPLAPKVGISFCRFEAVSREPLGWALSTHETARRRTQAMQETRAVLPLRLDPADPISPGLCAQVLSVLATQLAPTAFELVGNSDRIAAQLVVEKTTASATAGALEAGLSQSQIEVEAEDALAEALEKRTALCLREWVPRRLVLYPLRLFSGNTAFRPDPLGPLVGALGTIEEDQFAAVQILIQGAMNFREMILLLSEDRFESGLASLPGEAGLLEAAERKAGAGPPFFWVCIRLWASSEMILERLSGCLASFGADNQLVALPATQTHPPRLRRSIALGRYTHRPGWLAALNEMVGLVHPVAGLVFSEALEGPGPATIPLPKELRNRTGLLLGVNQHKSRRYELRLTPETYFNHALIDGGSGEGKSTLALGGIVLPWLEVGYGLAILDPHQDLIRDLLHRMPRNRRGDVIVIDPMVEDRPVALNILKATTERQKHRLIDNTVLLIERSVEADSGPQMRMLLGYLVSLGVLNEQEAALTDLRDCLVSGKARSTFLDSCTDSETVEFFRRDMAKYPRSAVIPVLTRLNSLLRSPYIRRTFSRKGGKLDLEQLMNKERPILAFSIPIGLLGERETWLLLGLVLSQLQQIVFERTQLPPEQRQPFLIVGDEVQEFITSSWRPLLSGARKEKCGIVAITQDCSLLAQKDREMHKALLTNPYLRCVFRCGPADARALGEQLGVKAPVLMRQKQYTCTAGLGPHTFTLEPQPLPPPAEDAEAAETMMYKQSSDRYGVADEAEPGKSQTAAPARPLPQDDEDLFGI